MQLTNFMPIIILLGMIIMLVLVVGKFKPKKRQTNSYNKFVQWGFGVYIAVLLLAVPAAFMIPEDAGFTAEVENAPSELPSLRKLASNGDIESTGQIYQEETWEMTADSEDIQLNMEGGNEPSMGLPILVERVSNQDNLIEAAYYQTPLIVEGIDMSDRLGAAGIDLSSGTMTIRPSDPIVVDLSLFKQEFPIAQFTGERWMENVYTGGEQLLYLKIPEDVQLDYNDRIEVHYVNGSS